MELSVSEFKSFLISLELDAKNGSTSNELYNRLKGILGNIKRLDYFLDPGKRLYRARFVDSIEDYKSIENISYPKPEFVRKHGRANLPHEPIFYASDSPVGPFFELNKLEPGKLVALSSWETSQVLPSHLIPFSSELVVSPDGALSDQTLVDEKSEIFDDWVCKIFTESVKLDEIHKYVLTSTVADIFLKFELNLKGPFGVPLVGSYTPESSPSISFPSLAIFENAWTNYAIHTAFVDDYLRFRSCDILQIDAIRESSITFTMLDHSTSIEFDQTLKWNKSPARLRSDKNSYNGGPITVSFDDADWSTRNEDGCIVYFDHWN